MTDPKPFLQRLHKNLQILNERAAKYAGQTPLALINQIEDHETAIALTEQAAAGEISQAEWQESLRPLLISVAPFQAAQQIVIVLGQYAVDQGRRLRQTGGPAAGKIAGEIFTTTLDHLRQSPEGAFIAGEFAADPETYHKPVEKALAQALTADSALVARLTELFAQYEQALKGRPAGDYQATISGTGSIAQGPGATAATATGGGIAIGGGVAGDVNIEEKK